MTILQLVMHEVHGPEYVGHTRHDQWLWFFPLEAPLGPDKQVQLQFTVNPPDTLVVSVKAFDVPQIIPAQTKAPFLWICFSRTSQSAISAFSSDRFGW